MRNPLNKVTPLPPSRPHPKQHRTETLRPFVQKYQYHQLPLPEPRPLAGEDVSTEQSNSDSGKEPCATLCHENS